MDGPERDSETEDGATAEQEAELELPVGHLLYFVHLGGVDVVRCAGAAEGRAGGVEAPGRQPREAALGATNNEDREEGRGGGG